MMTNNDPDAPLTVLDIAPNGAIAYACMVLEPSTLPTFIPIGSQVKVISVVEPNGYHHGGIKVQRLVDGEPSGGEEDWVR